MLDFTQIAHHQHHRARKLLHRSHKLSTSALGAVCNPGASVCNCRAGVRNPGASVCNCRAGAGATVRRPWCIFTNRHRFRPCFEPLFVKMHHLGPPNPNVPINPHRTLQLQRPLNASGDDHAGIATTKLPTQVVPSQTTRTGSNANAVVVNLKSFSRTL